MLWKKAILKNDSSEMKIRPQKETRKDVSRSKEDSKRAQNSPLAGAMREANPLASGLAGIRLQTESQEAESLGYKAFTRGNEVHFAPGEYRPDTTLGQEIIAHESVHVQQQALGRGRLGGFAGAGTLERQAQMQSPMVSAAPFGRMQGYSVVGAGAGGGGGKTYVPYEFKSKHFLWQNDPVENTLRSWYFGGHAAGYEIPYEEKSQVEAKQSLQAALNLINKDSKHRSSEIYLQPDGQFGSQTEKVIIAFQKKHGLNPDGVIGEQTAKLMDQILAELERHPSFVMKEVNSKIAGEQKYNFYSPKDEWERGHKFYSEITPELDKGKPAESVGWNAVNSYLQTKHVAEYLQAMGLLEKDAQELERQRLIHYRFQGWDEEEHVKQWIGETPEMENEEGWEGNLLHVTDRFSDASLPKTIKAIQAFQKRYGFPQTGRLVKGTREYEVFEKVGHDAWCKEWGVGKYSKMQNWKEEKNESGIPVDVILDTDSDFMND
jgi:peptidoglycan hydrolase-like protein with peptidoglycan-binding domain